MSVICLESYITLIMMLNEGLQVEIQGLKIIRTIIKKSIKSNKDVK